MRIAVIGGVNSTDVLVRGLARHGFKDCAVWGYVPAETTNVSGWCDLQATSAELNLQFRSFRKLAECEADLRNFAPDILFVVGLSQLVPDTMLDIASRANIGFHPTKLPEGRGRAAIAWLILKQMNGAATFFLLESGVDDGPVLVQQPFETDENDDAASIEAKILSAEAHALDTWLPELHENGLKAHAQNHANATWFGRRTPQDGWLDWSLPRNRLMRLIRASTPPHPGAYTFCGDKRIEILAASYCDRPETGVTGRIVAVGHHGSFEVQCGDSLLRVENWRCDTDWTPKTGILLGYYVEAEVFSLRQRVTELETRIAAITHQLTDAGLKK